MSIQNDYLDHARNLARQAGEVLLDGRPDFARNSILETTSKSSPTDLVSEKDLASEKAIVDGILSRYPDDGIVGEEGTNRSSKSGMKWIIDPLDGTINYIYGSGFWSVSIAVADQNGVFAAVVYVPLLDLEFYAVRGQGAYRVDRFGNVKLPKIGEVEMKHALCATGFAYKEEIRKEQSEQFLTIITKIRDIRRVGSAAFDLCMVACGNVNAYFERTAQIWDIAAGTLIVEEVGGIVSGLNGKAPGPDFTIAGPPILQSQLVKHFENC